MECNQVESVEKILIEKNADYSRQGSVITVKFAYSKDAIDILSLP